MMQLACLSHHVIVQVAFLLFEVFKTLYSSSMKYMSKSFDRCHVFILELPLSRFIELAHITSFANICVG
jgi:hypothetical protein